MRDRDDAEEAARKVAEGRGLSKKRQRDVGFEVRRSEDYERAMREESARAMGLRPLHKDHWANTYTERRD